MQPFIALVLRVALMQNVNSCLAQVIEEVSSELIIFSTNQPTNQLTS